MTLIESYKDLIVWQKSMQLVVRIYKLTNELPKIETYNLVSQMRRSSIAIPSNIAEGRKWGSRKEFRRFLTIAYGSGTELETQIEIAKRLDYINNCQEIDDLLNEVMRMLNKILSTLRKPNA